MLRLRRAVTLALVWSSSAAADSEPEVSTSGATLAVTSADSCLTPDSTLREIDRFRPRRPEDGRLRIELREEGLGVIATILRDSEVLGERSFPNAPARCGERRRLVGIALAVALERLAPEITADALPEADQERVADAPPAPPARPEGSPHARAPARARSFEWTTAMHGEASAGLFPTPGVGAGFAVGGRWRLGSLELGADWQRGLSYALGPGEVDLSLLTASARGCLALGARGRLQLDGCLAMLAGEHRASGRGYGTDLETREAWAAASAGLRASIALSGSLGVRSEVDATVPILRSAFEVRDGSATIRAQTTPAGVSATFGPTLSF